jgi:hypothetical protein
MGRKKGREQMSRFVCLMMSLRFILSLGTFIADWDAHVRKSIHLMLLDFFSWHVCRHHLSRAIYHTGKIPACHDLY